MNHLVVPPPGPDDEHPDEGDHGGDEEQEASHALKYGRMVLALRELGLEVDKLRSGEEWQAWLQQAAKFHRYSFRNQLLIWMQLPTATQVAGYRKWQTMGRQVRKGERHLKILAPVTRRNTDEELYVAGWKLARVFDVSQTDGDDLAEFPPWPEAESCPEGMYQATVEQIAAVENLDVTVVTEETAVSEGVGGSRGWYDPKDLGIRIVGHDRTEASMMGTLLHELGHHFDPELMTDHDRRSKELVAQSAAYLAGGQLDVGLAETSKAYAAGWCRHPEDLLALADRSVTAARKIHDTLTKDLEVQP